jgi:hypothetical protein
LNIKFAVFVADFVAKKSNHGGCPYDGVGVGLFGVAGVVFFVRGLLNGIAYFYISIVDFGN